MRTLSLFLLTLSTVVACSRNATREPREVTELETLAAIWGEQAPFELALEGLDAAVPCSAALGDALTSEEVVEGDLRATKVAFANCGGEVTPGSRRFEELAAWIAGLPDERARRGRGLVALLLRQWDEAVTELEDEVAQAADPAAVRNDLAVALALRATERSVTGDLVRALDLLASAAAQGSEPAAKNLAVVADRIGLESVAERVQSGSPPLDLLDIANNRSADAEPGGTDMAASGEAVEEPTTDQLLARADRFDGTPHQAREFALGALAAGWSRELSAGRSDSAARLMAAWTALGAASGQDRSVLLAAQRAFRSPDLHPQYELYDQGYRLYREGSYASATPLFRQVEQILTPLGSPVAAWACLWQAAIAESEGHADTTRRQLEQCRALARGEELPAVRATADWVEGLLVAREGDYGKARSLFQSSAELFRGASEEDRFAAMLVLLANLDRVMGNDAEAWAARSEALSAFRTLPASPFRITLLWDAALAAKETDSPRAARLFLEEGASTMAPQSTIEYATLLMRAAQLENALEDFDRAGLLLDAVERLLTTVPGHGARDRTAAIVSVVRGEAVLSESPGQAVEYADAALAALTVQQNTIVRNQALRLRARALIELGQDDEAISSLRNAAREAIAAKDELADPLFRGQLLEAAQKTFDLLIHQLVVNGRPGEALGELERSRGLEVGTTDGNWGEAASRLGADHTLVSYAVVGSDLHVWKLDEGGLRHSVRQGAVPQLREWTVGMGASALQSVNGRAAHSNAATLFGELIAPLDLAPSGGKVAIVPDRFLQNVPFAALYDAENARYFVESHSIVVTPSVSWYLDKHQTASRAQFQPERLLAVSQSEGWVMGTNALPQLTWATREGRLIAGAYPNSTILDGDEATPERVREALPESGLFHYAGHALRDPGRGSAVLLLPEPAGGVAGVSVTSLGLDAASAPEVVVLSACGTSVASDRRGRTFSGLAREFLSTGVDVVVGTVAPVRDRELAPLWEGFYSRLREGLLVDEALRAAQLDLLRQRAQLSTWGTVQLSV